MELKHDEDNNMWYYLNNGSWLYLPRVLAEHIKELGVEVGKLKEELVFLHNDGSKQFIIGEQKQKIEGLEKTIDRMDKHIEKYSSVGYFEL